jgi:diguanylate cyclase (GGDEF)-like protein/PAS domain S-box-containing protein
LFKAYLASLRLAIALVCLGATLIIGGISLGLMPDESAFAEQALALRRQGIALTAASLVRDQRPEGLRRILQLMVDQNMDLVKIEIDTGDEILEVANSWTTPRASKIAPALQAANDRKRPENALGLPQTVVMELAGVTYGTAKFYHRPVAPATWIVWARLPLVRLVAFFVVAGLAVYTVFVRRVMQAFEVTQIIPDRVRQALNTLPEGLLVMDENERIILANQSFSKAVGWSQEKLTAKRVQSLPWIRSAKTKTEDFPWTRSIRESKPLTEQLMTFRLADGSTLDFSVNTSPFESYGSDARGVLATFRDVTMSERDRADREQAIAVLQYSQDEISSKNRELKILATRDALTGCMNRRSFTEAVETRWHESKRSNAPIACLMIDNDRFKSVNDRYGHHVGDEVLRQVAQILKDCFPLPSMVCRYGGEEFCVCMPETTLEVAEQKAEVARARIETFRLDDPALLRVTVSIGGSEKRFGASDAHELINQADKALYVAKGNGRNQVVVFGDSVFTSAIESTIVRDHPGITAADGTDLPFQAVTALVSALAHRDSETAEHSRRVADLCVRMASGMLDERDAHMLEIAGLLHDIGKIGVPDDVLLKPGPLSEEEWSVMRQHDRIGVDIATSTFNCDELSELIRTHRAFFGGIGPSGSLPAGDDIPLAARLLTIADGYDAMVTDQVYRKARSHDEAIAELRRSAGTQFDPALVEYFAEVMTRERSMSDKPSEGLAEKIGPQIQELEAAIASQDLDGIQTIACKVGAMARYHRIQSLTDAAEKIEATTAEEDILCWSDVLRDTKRLLNLCKSSLRESHREQASQSADPARQADS